VKKAKRCTGSKCRTVDESNLQKLNYKFTIFRQEATSALAGLHAGPLSWSNLNLEMLVFVEGGKPENPEKNPRSKVRTKTNSTHTWNRAGIEPGPHWWEASALTTAPSLLPKNIQLYTN